VHGAVIDELHAHTTPDLVETVESGTGSRLQPLVVIITTADAGKRETIYDRRRTYVEQLARGALTDETHYGVVWCATEDDDPFAESTWKAANPGYGVSPTRAYLKAASAKAQNSPAELSAYLRLHLGIRTRQLTRYIELHSWDTNASMVDPRKLAGRDAYGGLDLAAVSDLTALCWLFPDDAGGYDAVWRLWTPERNLPKLDQRTAGAATAWTRSGVLSVTPGNVIDYDFIRAQIDADRDTFKVKSIGYDPWNASQITNDLVNAGAPMVKVRQGFITLSPPLKEIQRLLLTGTTDKPLLRHGGNPAVRWMVDNLAVAMDPAGNVKPDKANGADKIDAVSALVTAMSEAMTRPKPGSRRAVGV
jgi:phage terminase large subunit-like protein